MTSNPGQKARAPQRHSRLRQSLQEVAGVEGLGEASGGAASKGQGAAATAQTDQPNSVALPGSEARKDGPDSGNPAADTPHEAARTMRVYGGVPL